MGRRRERGGGGLPGSVVNVWKLWALTCSTGGPRCALQQCVACGQLGQEKRREDGGEVHVKAGVFIIVLGKRSCKILIAF